MIDIEASRAVDMRSDVLRHLGVLRRKQSGGLQPSLVKADVAERQIENVGQHGVTRYVTTQRIANDETAQRRNHKSIMRIGGAQQSEGGNDRQKQARKKQAGCRKHRDRPKNKMRRGQNGGEGERPEEFANGDGGSGWEGGRGRGPWGEE